MGGAVRLMRTRIRLLAQPESMSSIVSATQQERWFGLALNWCLNRDAVTDTACPVTCPHALHQSNLVACE